jgi:carbon-monoxide dehydrogenase small subunit/isoquinoline 1-oxidoreductase alpha subunit/xanthine dehydrogenase YagT iron-sulfur-binding subunit
MTADKAQMSNGATGTLEDDRVLIRLRVNGQEHHVRVRTHHTLLEVLRNQLHLYSVREGCGIGVCGACTVLMDRKPVSSCLILAPLAEGKDTLTVEGLTRDDGQLDPIQEAYLDHTGFQCSYCTAGFLLTTKALLEENSDPSAEEVRAYLSGNLCRCGSYVKILDSVMAAKERLKSRNG